MALYDEDVKDEIAHEKALNAEQRLAAREDAAGGKKNEELFKTDWDYRLAHKAATTGRKIADINTDRMMAKTTARANQRATHLNSLSGDDGWRSVGKGRSATASDASRWAHNYVADGREGALRTQAAGIVAGTKPGENPRARINEWAEKWTAETMKARGITGANAGVIQQQLRAMAKKVASWALNGYEARERAANRAERSAAEAKRMNGSIQMVANGDMSLGQWVEAEKAKDPTRPNLVTKNIVRALTHGVKTGAVSVRRLRRMQGQLRKMGHSTLYGNLMQMAIDKKSGIKSKASVKVGNKLRVKMANIRTHMAENPGDRKAHSTSLGEYKKELEAKRRDGELTDAHYAALKQSYASTFSALSKSVAQATRVTQMAQLPNGLHKASKSDREAAYHELVRRAGTEQDGTRVSSDGQIEAVDPKQAAIKKMAEAGGLPDSWLAPRVRMVQGAENNPAAAHQAAREIESMRALGNVDWQMKDILPLLNRARETGAYRGDPTAFGKVAETLKKDGQIADPYQWFFGTEKPGEGGKAGRLTAAITEAVKDLDGDGDVKFTMDLRRFQDKILTFAKLNNIPTGSGKEGIKKVIEKMVESNAVHMTYTFRNGQVVGRYLHMKSDPTAANNPGARINGRLSEVRAHMSTLQAHLGRRGVDPKTGKVHGITFGGELSLENAKLTLIPQGKSYLVSETGSTPIKIAPGRLIGAHVVAKKATAADDGRPKVYGSKAEAGARDMAVHADKQKRYESASPNEQERMRKEAKSSFARWRSAYNVVKRSGFESKPNRLGWMLSDKKMSAEDWEKKYPRPWDPTQVSAEKPNDTARTRKLMYLPTGLNRQRMKDWLKKNATLPARFSWKVETNTAGVVTHVMMGYSPSAVASATPELDKRTGMDAQKKIADPEVKKSVPTTTAPVTKPPVESPSPSTASKVEQDVAPFVTEAELKALRKTKVFTDYAKFAKDVNMSDADTNRIVKMVNKGEVRGQYEKGSIFVSKHGSRSEQVLAHELRHAVFKTVPSLKAPQAEETTVKLLDLVFAQDKQTYKTALRQMVGDINQYQEKDRAAVFTYVGRYLTAYAEIQSKLKKPWQNSKPANVLNALKDLATKERNP